MPRLATLALLPLLFAVGCAGRAHPDGFSADDESPIVRGSALSLPQVRERGLVGLVASLGGDRTGYCSGTLVADRLVITAAHCARTPKGPVAYATFGVDAFGADRVTVSIATLVRHPTADLALVHLASDAPASWSRLAVAKAPRASQNGKLIELAGFGRSTAENAQSGGPAQSLTVRIGNLEPMAPIFTVTSTGAGACFGDSGGPAYGASATRAVIGVLSNGNAGCRGGDTYVSTGNFERWIATNSGGLITMTDAFAR